MSAAAGLVLHTNTHIHVSEAIQSTLLAGKRQVGTHRVEIIAGDVRT